MERFELYPFKNYTSKKIIENDNPKLKTKNIINQIFEITTFEGVCTVITQLITLFHSLLINYENNGFNPEIYTELEKLKHI